MVIFHEEMSCKMKEIKEKRNKWQEIFWQNGINNWGKGENISLKSLYFTALVGKVERK